MNIPYRSWRDLWRLFLLSLRNIVGGLGCLIIIPVASVVILSITFARLVKGALHRWPLRALLVCLALMSLVTLAVYMQMRTKLTTAEWQRDQLQLTVDSVRAAEQGHTVRYMHYNE
jgi:hypothetical protein